MEKLIFGLLFLTIIVLDAIGEGFRDRALEITKELKSFLLLSLLGCMLFFQTLYWPIILWSDQCILLILAYIFIRLALYDVIYNITVGYPYIFIITGNTYFNKICDKFINWLLTKSRFGNLVKLPKDFFLMGIRFITLIFGLLLIKWAF